MKNNEKIAIISMLLIAVSIIVAILAYEIGNPKPWSALPDYPVQGRANPDHKHILSRMHYHGTLVAFRIGDKWYFLRENKRCKLW
jgi:hypothetical protein